MVPGLNEMKNLLYVVVALVAAYWIFGPSGGGGSRVGQRLPSVPLEYLGPNPRILGSPVLLEFWATWCGPCRQSIPHLNQLHETFRNRGLIVLGVTKEPRETVLRFQREIPMNYAVALDPQGTLGQRLGVRSIPAAFLVSRLGEIVWSGHPMELTEARVEEFLAQKVPQ